MNWYGQLSDVKEEKGKKYEVLREKRGLGSEDRNYLLHAEGTCKRPVPPPQVHVPSFDFSGAISGQPTHLMLEGCCQVPGSVFSYLKINVHAGLDLVLCQPPVLCSVL